MGYAFWDNTKLELDFGFVIMECRLGPKLSHSALRQSTLLRLVSCETSLNGQYGPISDSQLSSRDW